MKKKKIILKKTLLSAFSIGLASSVVAESVEYVIRKKDTLSEVLYAHKLLPIWGKEGSVAQTLKLNPDLKNSRGNFLRPGQTILLPIQKDDKTVAASSDRRPGQDQDNEQQVTPVEEKPVSQDSEITSNKSPHNYGKLKAGVYQFYTALEMQDKLRGETAEFLSRLNHGFYGSWEQQWDENNRTFFTTRSEKHTYESIGELYVGKTYNLMGISAGYERRLSDRFSVRGTLSAKERLFARATSLTSIILDRTLVREIEITPSYDLFSMGQFDLKAELSYAYLASGKTSHYSIQSGSRIGTALTLTQHLQYIDLEGRVFYGVEEQDTTISTKKSEMAGIAIGVGWSFGK